MNDLLLRSGGGVDTGGGTRPPSPASCLADAVKGAVTGGGSDAIDRCATALSGVPVAGFTSSGIPTYPIQGGSGPANRKYVPSPNHDPVYGWDPDATPMDLDDATAQTVLDNGYQSGKKVYGYYNGKFYEFQPDNQGGYHGYSPPAGKVPAAYLRQLRDQGDITNAKYHKVRREPRRK